MILSEVMYAKFERALAPEELRQQLRQYNPGTQGWSHLMMTKITIERPGNSRTINWDERPRRHVLMEFLATLKPEDVYGITEQGQGDSQLTVVYYRLRNSLAAAVQDQIEIDKQAVHEVMERSVYEAIERYIRNPPPYTTIRRD